MKLIDIFLLLVISWGGYNGFKRGFIFEILSIGALVLTALGSMGLLDGVLGLCVEWYAQVELLPCVAFFVSLFVIISIAITWAKRLLKALIKPTLLGNLDGFLGSVFGVFKWSMCSSAFLWLGSLVQLKIPETYTEDTFILPIVESLLPHLLAWGALWVPSIQEWLITTTTRQNHPLQT